VDLASTPHYAKIYIECRVSCLLIFQRERTSVGVLFNEVLTISLFQQFPLQMRHVSAQTIIIITQNQHQWAEKNPHGVIEEQFSINVWPEIAGDCLVGAHVLPHRLMDNHYRDFLFHDLPKLLEGVLLAVRNREAQLYSQALGFHFVASYDS
jgi:hypothetical protein